MFYFLVESVYSAKTFHAIALFNLLFLRVSLFRTLLCLMVKLPHHSYEWWLDRTSVDRKSQNCIPQCMRLSCPNNNKKHGCQKLGLVDPVINFVCVLLRAANRIAIASQKKSHRMNFRESQSQKNRIEKIFKNRIGIANLLRFFLRFFTIFLRLFFAFVGSEKVQKFGYFWLCSVFM